MNPRLIKMEQSPTWHDLLHVMQSGQQHISDEQMDAVTYTVCKELDLLKGKLNPDLYSVILGLLSQQIFAHCKENTKLAVVEEFQ